MQVEEFASLFKKMFLESINRYQDTNNIKCMLYDCLAKDPDKKDIKVEFNKNTKEFDISFQYQIPFVVISAKIELEEKIE